MRKLIVTLALLMALLPLSHAHASTVTTTTNICSQGVDLAVTPAQSICEASGVIYAIYNH